MKKIFLAFLLCLSLFFIGGVEIASAQETNLPRGESNTPRGESNTPKGESNNPLSVNFRIDNPFSVGNNLYDLVESVVNNIILPIGGVLCVLAFIYAGFLYVMAGGDTGQIKTAHNALLYASVGTAILLGAWMIASVIRNTITQVIN